MRWCYTLKDGDKEPDPKNAISLYLKSKGGFFPSVTNLNTPDVGYSCVIEEAFDKDNKVARLYCASLL